MIGSLVILLSSLCGAAHLYPIADVEASSETGGKYTAGKAVDGLTGTRWASSDHAALPQWIEVRLKEPSTVDAVMVRLPDDRLYSPWRDIELSFSEGEAVRETLEEGTTEAVVRFDPRTTDRVRITVMSVHDVRHYVGAFEITVAHDPEEALGGGLKTAKPLSRDEVVVKGRKGHPCVNVTQADVAATRERVESQPWARAMRDRIVADADQWLRESDAYWLEFLPESGACYAYGFTGCPITGKTFGTWAGARCSWDRPGKVMNGEGRLLPDEEYPDDGTGYKAPDGRMHYFTGIWNAWVTEQWTLRALPALSQAYLLTGDERYAQRGALLLDALASIYAESTSGSWDYPSNPPSGRFARPWYQVARTLVKFVDQYDFMYNSPAMDEVSLRPGMTRRENIETYLIEDGAYYCYEHSFHGALHNGHADYLRGALAAGCLLDIPEYVRIAVEGPFSIATMLSNNIDRDGRYYESALGYAIHARLLYLTFADPLVNLRSEAYPEGVNLYDDPRMQSSLFMPDLQVEVAGRRPNFGDAGPDYAYKPFPNQPFSRTDYRFLERLYAMTSDDARRSEFGAALQRLADEDVTNLRAAHGDGWLLWHAGDAPKETPNLAPELSARVDGSWVAGMKGMALLRTGDQAAVLRFGPSLNHGDPDDLALLYYADGYELSYDIGYGLGSTHVHCGWASSTVSHCLVTVDEANQLQAPGSGGSLNFFADLPRVDVVEATSELSYSARDVSEYRRTIALTEAGYLVDVFRVRGGQQHDYGFGSIGTELSPFGVTSIEKRPGSLAEGRDWGQQIGNDADIKGYPQKPYWNPPPGNGYGFFFNVKAGEPEPVWGGEWAIAGTVPTRFRMHVASSVDEAIFVTAPGLYPTYPLSSYVIARRESEGDAPLASTFLAVYEPYVVNAFQYAFDCNALLARICDNTAEVKPLTTLGSMVLKGTKAGDSMSFRLTLSEGQSNPLVLHCVTAPSYGTMQVEWDGKPVGEPLSLFSDGVQAPRPFVIGEVNTTAGDHTLTIRVEDGAAFFLGLAAVSFGEATEEDAACTRRLAEMKRLDDAAVEVVRVDGAIDLILSGPCDAVSRYGHVEFEGDFAYLTGDGSRLKAVETLGCAKLACGGKVVDEGPAAFEAHVVEVDLATRSVLLDRAPPNGLARLMAVFSNPAYSRTTGYHVLRVEGRRVFLQASTFVLGVGQVKEIIGPTELNSAIPHEYARAVKGAGSSRFFDGKRLVAESGAETRVTGTVPGGILRVEVEDTSVLRIGDRFEYIDLSVGDTVRVALPRVVAEAQLN